MSWGRGGLADALTGRPGLAAATVMWDLVRRRDPAALLRLDPTALAGAGRAVAAARRRRRCGAPLAWWKPRQQAALAAAVRLAATGAARSVSWPACPARHCGGGGEEGGGR